METKVIHMTYKKAVPYKVYDRWKQLNPDFDIQLNLDIHCIDFLKKRFTPEIAKLFMTIPQGMYKADLWRLCRLYEYGGAYADVDLVPYLNIDELDKNTFYSCLADDPRSIFQAFMVSLPPKNPLMLCFLISFLMNHPYNYPNGPCYDMANVLKYNLDVEFLRSDIVYSLDQAKVRIPLGQSNVPTKCINLGYFPPNLKYTLSVVDHSHPEMFQLNIVDNMLVATRIDTFQGWRRLHYIDICFPYTQNIYLFKEIVPPTGHQYAYVIHKGVKVLDSRDIDYFRNRGW
jgi:hypothetical protein